MNPLTYGFPKFRRNPIFSTQYRMTQHYFTTFRKKDQADFTRLLKKSIYDMSDNHISINKLRHLQVPSFRILFKSSSYKFKLYKPPPVKSGVTGFLFYNKSTKIQVVPQSPKTINPSPFIAIYYYRCSERRYAAPK